MKKIVSILLVLTLLVNIFGFGFMNIRAGAELATAAVVTILGLVSGFVGTGLGGLLANATDDFINRLSDSQKDLIYKINYNAIKNGELIQIDWLKKDCFVPMEGLTGENLKFAEYFCDKLNSSEDLEQILKGFGYSYDGQAYVQDSPDTMERDISSLNYAKFKSECINAFNEYMALNNYIEGAQNLAETGDFPTYDFDFVGPLDPLTHITIPGSEKIVSTKKDGFLHSVPWTIERSDGYYSKTFSAWGDAGGTASDEWYSKTIGGTKYYEYLQTNFVQGYVGTGIVAGVYVIYNDELYYKNTVINGGRSGITSNLRDSGIGSFVNSRGEKLNTKGCKTLVGLMGGAYCCKTSETGGNYYPKELTSIDDLKEIQPQKDILYPLDDDEAAIGESIAAGLLPQDFMLKLNELGNIISANNIPIEQLTSLLENLKEGQLKFDDFEQYLQYISALLSAGNIDRQTSAKILNNIRALQEQTNDNINVVNTAISGIKELDEERNETLARIDANTATIAEAITTGAIISAGTDFDVRTPNIITDKFPFSLPFDIYHVFNLLSATPQAPRWEVPIEMEGVFDYSIEVDLSEYDWIANIVRWFLYAAFIVGLIIITNKLIGRG